MDIRRNKRSTRWWCLKFDFSVKYCTNYDDEVKTLEQGAQVVLDLTETNSEDIVFLTDSPSVLDSLAGHGEHNLRRKTVQHIRTQKSDPTVDSSTLWYQRK